MSSFSSVFWLRIKSGEGACKSKKSCAFTTEHGVTVGYTLHIRWRDCICIEGCIHDRWTAAINTNVSTSFLQGYQATRTFF